ncbi:MAG: hypothetical protein H0V63_03855 [Burkholderiaceae bacterium]|nr:hypothetical protein [Burkholderiaceae bacterium]
MKERAAALIPVEVDTQRGRESGFERATELSANVRIAPGAVRVNLTYGA